MDANRSSAEFSPLPLLGNPHVQTVLGSVLRVSRLPAPSRIRHVHLPDGDQIVLHDSIPPGWRPGGRITLLLHGLVGSHRSGYLLRLAMQLLPKRVRVVRMDLRGAGRGFALAQRSYHAGCSDDVRAAIADLRRAAPDSPVIVVGFSLGGNVALKLAGESAERPVEGLEAVAAVGPPIDLAACSGLLAQPQNRFYELHFLRDLVRLARRRQRLFPASPAVPFPSLTELTLPQFDELYTAPTWGFADAADYYSRSSSLPLIPRIQVPTLILTARDDPFIAVAPFESLPDMPNLKLQIVPKGGHLGWLGWDGAGGIRWGERQVANWLLRS